MPSFIEELKQVFSGDILTDEESLKKYSRDASLLEVKPSIIVAPKSVDDIKELVAFVSRKNAEGGARYSLSARSGGTATKWDRLPMSMPAAWGCVIVRAGRVRPVGRLTFALRRAMACSIMRVDGGAASGTSSNALSQTGYRSSGHTPPGRFTSVDDVTQDHANPRAVCTTAMSVFRGAAFHLATTEATVFLRRDVRRGADWDPNP